MEKKMENEMETVVIYGVICVVLYLGVLWYPFQSKILSSFLGIVCYIRNILQGSSTKKNYSHEESSLLKANYALKPQNP